jgi:hypothetical protein
MPRAARSAHHASWRLTAPRSGSDPRHTTTRTPAPNSQDSATAPAIRLRRHDLIVARCSLVLPSALLIWTFGGWRMSAVAWRRSMLAPFLAPSAGRDVRRSNLRKPVASPFLAPGSLTRTRRHPAREGSRCRSGHQPLDRVPKWSQLTSGLSVRPQAWGMAPVWPTRYLPQDWCEARHYLR